MKNEFKRDALTHQIFAQYHESDMKEIGAMFKCFTFRKEEEEDDEPEADPSPKKARGNVDGGSTEWSDCNDNEAMGVEQKDGKGGGAA